MTTDAASLASVAAFVPVAGITNPDDWDTAQGLLNLGTRLLADLAPGRQLLWEADVTRAFDAPVGALLRVPDIALDVDGAPAIVAVLLGTVPLVQDTDYVCVPAPDGGSIWGLLHVTDGRPSPWLPAGSSLAAFRAVQVQAAWGLAPVPSELAEWNIAVALELWRDRDKRYAETARTIGALGAIGGNPGLVPAKVRAGMRLYWRGGLSPIVPAN